MIFNLLSLINYSIFLNLVCVLHYKINQHIELAGNDNVSVIFIGQ